MTRFLLFLAVSALCRASDLLSTWLVTPDLRGEINPLIRWCGWRWSITLNIAACLLSTVLPAAFFYSLCGFSILATLWNMRIYLHRRS